MIADAKPDMAEAIRLCAIPHRINKEILALLRGEGREPSERTGTMLTELQKLDLISRPLSDYDYVCHESVRNVLLGRWRTENSERFQELNG